MDKQLFETFYSENYKELVKYLKRSHLLKEDVEDLAQDIFLELYQKNDLNESHLWKLAKSRLYNFIRDRARRKHQEKEFIEFLKEFFKRINKDE